MTYIIYVYLFFFTLYLSILWFYLIAGESEDCSSMSPKLQPLQPHQTEASTFANSQNLAVATWRHDRRHHEE